MLDPGKKFWPTERPTQNILDPRKKSLTHAKAYLTHVTHVKIMSHVKNILTYVTHATHEIFDPRNPRDLADSYQVMHGYIIICIFMYIEVWCIIIAFQNCK